MAMQEETEESAYRRPEEDSEESEEQERHEGARDGYEDNPRAALEKLGRSGSRVEADARSFKRTRRRSTGVKRPPPPSAVRVRMMMDEDNSSTGY